MTTSAPAYQRHLTPQEFSPRTGSLQAASRHRPDIESAAFIDAMRAAATGVNIVTTDGAGGRFGLTVSAFSSVSAQPPTLLVCINRRSPACGAIRSNRRFCVNVLSAAQRNVADTFAGKPATGNAYDFDVGAWTCSPSGSPVLEQSAASFDCAVDSTQDAGTHVIFIGSVKAVTYSDRDALIYTRGAYRHAGSKA